MINFQYQSQLNSSTLQKRDIVCYKDVELSTKKGKKKGIFQSFRKNPILLHYAHNSDFGKKSLGKSFVNFILDIFKMSILKISNKVFYPPIFTTQEIHVRKNSQNGHFCALFFIDFCCYITKLSCLNFLSGSNSSSGSDSMSSLPIVVNIWSRMRWSISEPISDR